MNAKTIFFERRNSAIPFFLVAEDEKQGGDILGIMGVGGPVAVRLKGEIIRGGGFVFDWRSNPLAQKGLQRHMLRLWQAAQAEIAQRNLDFVFGYVKEDNERSLGILKKIRGEGCGNKRVSYHARTRPLLQKAGRCQQGRF